MTPITPGLLRKIMPRCPTARLEPCASALSVAGNEFSIDSPVRVAAFLAQVAHETAELTRIRENLNYGSAGRLLVVFPSRFGLRPGASAEERAAGQAKARELVGQPRDLAEFVYGQREDLGNTVPGDGWNYRGAWMLGLTGRDNYARAGERLGIDLEAHPELIENPEVGARAGAAFWEAIEGNRLADSGQFSALSKRIGPIGLPDRKVYWKRARAALGLP